MLNSGWVWIWKPDIKLRESYRALLIFRTNMQKKEEEKQTKRGMKRRNRWRKRVQPPWQPIKGPEECSCQDKLPLKAGSPSLGVLYQFCRGQRVHAHALTHTHRQRLFWWRVLSYRIRMWLREDVWMKSDTEVMGVGVCVCVGSRGVKLWHWSK